MQNMGIYIYIFVSISYSYLKNGQISNCDAIHQFSVTSGKFAAKSSAAELVKLDWTSLATVEISQHAALQQHLVHYGTGESVTRGQGYKDGTGLAFSAVLGDNAAKAHVRAGTMGDVLLSGCGTLLSLNQEIKNISVDS